MRKNDGLPLWPAWALGASVLAALLLLLYEPVPGGRRYEYALIQALSLTAVWLLAATRPETFFGRRVLAFILFAGLVLGAANLAVVRSDSEIVRAYGTVFEALDSGRNPYAAGTIHHEIEGAGEVLGDFNYPPLEIAPYYLAYRVSGTWNATVLVATMVLIQAVCALLLFRVLPRVRPILLLPFLPMVLLGEVKTNVALTFLFAALIARAVVRQEDAPRPGRRLALAVLFGLGALTKFLILPLMAAYYVHETDPRDPRSLARTGRDLAVASAVAFAVMAPFGVGAVLRNTLLFNVVLEDRAVLTTFYPNVLSGPLAWLGLSALYPAAALVLVAGTIVAARKLPVLPAMLAASCAFMLAASTPEPQFLPVIVFLVAVMQGRALERGLHPRPVLEEAPDLEEGRGLDRPPDARRARGAAVTGLFALLVAASAAPVRASARPETPAAFSLALRPPDNRSRWTIAPVPASPSASVLFASDGSAGLRGTRPAAGSGPRATGKRLRAWLEQLAFSVATTVNYWAGDSFPEDRDFAIDAESQFSRVFLLDGLRFDSNQFSLNWSHVLAGATYYQFGRTNGQTWFYSWLMSVAGSTWWEIVGEPKEVISINDQIITGLGGFATGEPWYRIGHFLCHQRGFLPRALGFLNPAVKFNHWLDRRDPAAETYVAPGWHEMRLFAGARRIAAGGLAPATDVYFGLEVRLLDLPEYGRPGAARRAVDEPYISEISFDMAARGGRAEETRFATRTVTWGRHVQRIAANGDGYSLTVGLGSSFELFKKRPLAEYDAHPVPVRTDLTKLLLDQPRRFTDKLALLHVAGPVVDLTLFRRGFRLRATVEASLDFGLVNALALNDYSLGHDIAGLKTTVFYYGYYYGLGGSVSAAVRLDWGGLRLRVMASSGAWSSFDYLDRFAAAVTNNARLEDGRRRLLLGAAWRVPGTALEAFAEVEEVRRRGRLAEVAARARETKLYAGLAFTF